MTLRLREKNEFSRSYLTEELNENDREAYDRFIEKIKERLDLPRKQTQLMIADFNAALTYYVSQGLSLCEAMERIDPSNLGEVYSQKETNFFPLDNAAVVYPLGMKFGRMPMFRVSAYLKEMVVPEILQMALNFTVKRYPSFATTIKAGFFWHYLDSDNMRYSIEHERVIPCIPINVSGTRAQVFRVLYYKKRISLEFFHVLTDGTGAMMFLKTLVSEYMRLLDHVVTFDESCWSAAESPRPEETVNEFARAQIREGVSGFMGNKAVQMNGRISDMRPCRVLHFEMDAERLHEIASGHGVTITAYLLAQMFVAIKKASKGKKGDIRIQVPVNMRKFNKSCTVRNYAMYFDCTENIDDVQDAASLLEDISRQLSGKSSQPEMERMMSTTIKLVRTVKYIPLIIKKPAVQIAYGFLGDTIFTTFLSNLGIIQTPAEMHEFVDHFDFILGPSDLCRASCGLISYNGHTVLSITKITADTTFEDEMYRLLTEDGLNVDVTGSGLYAD